MSEGRARPRDERAVMPLHQACDAAQVGGKAAALGALLARGHRVPAGFVVTASACSTVNGALPAALERELAAALIELGDGPLALRSSAASEDGRDASFAGQLFSALDVRGAEAVAMNLVRCVQSVRAPAVTRYRAERARDAYAYADEREGAPARARGE